MRRVRIIPNVPHRSNNDYQIVFDKADSAIQKVEEDSGIMLNK